MSRCPAIQAKFVTIIPAYRLVLPMAMSVAVRWWTSRSYRRPTMAPRPRGQFYVDWEDSFAGGDYDQDMWGIISYEITATQVKITTKPVLGVDH